MKELKALFYGINIIINNTLVYCSILSLIYSMVGVVGVRSSNRHLSRKKWDVPVLPTKNVPVLFWANKLFSQQYENIYNYSIYVIFINYKREKWHLEQGEMRRPSSPHQRCTSSPICILGKTICFYSSMKNIYNVYIFVILINHI